jgi:hypothetical protein
LNVPTVEELKVAVTVRNPPGRTKLSVDVAVNCTPVAERLLMISESQPSFRISNVAVAPVLHNGTKSRQVVSEEQ